MKLLYNRYLILVFILCFSGCKKEEIIHPRDISGHWSWIKTYTLPPTSDSPLTPQNTGIQETLVFLKDHTWYNTIDNAKVDSGMYTIGHGSYTPYPGATVFIYDSIAYFNVEGTRIRIGDYYEIRNDTLQFCPGYAGRFSSYTLPYNGSKFWIKN